MKKTTATIIIIFVIFLLLLTAAVVSPYIKAEYLTARYGDQFEGLEKQTNMLDGATYFKVLSYSEAQAKVFYVSDSGDVITFAKNQEGQWTIQNWYTVWSNTGSADSFYWPYYRGIALITAWSFL